MPRLERVLEDPGADIPDLARDICRMLLEQIAYLTDRIKALKAMIAAMSNEAEMPRRLQTMPGIKPITALAVETFAPPKEQFRRGRDFAAWLGLVPRQHSTGGKQKLGKTSKMGQRDIRRLLVIGATAVIRASRRDRQRAHGWRGCSSASRSRSWRWRWRTRWRAGSGRC